MDLSRTLTVNKKLMTPKITDGTYNNFNAMRFLAASAVVLSHSYALTHGDPRAEPLRETLGISLGQISIDVFFIASGFLVTSSLLRRSSVWDFLVSRALRVYPALWVMLLISVFALGPIVSELTLVAYMSDPDTYRYFAQNAILVFGASYELPGVFGTTPYPDAVNGSLWSMPIEIRLYLLLPLLWTALAIIRQRSNRALITASSVILLVCLTLTFLKHLSGEHVNNNIRLCAMFFSGTLFYTLRERISLSPWILLALTAITVISLLDSRVFFLIYSLTLPYIVIFFAYYPNAVLGKLSGKDDVSYGIYIYSFPIQQAVTLYLPEIPPLTIFAYSMSITLLFAFLSWRLIEKRSLELKKLFHKSAHRTQTVCKIPYLEACERHP